MAKNWAKDWAPVASLPNRLQIFYFILFIYVKYKNKKKKKIIVRITKGMHIW